MLGIYLELSKARLAALVLLTTLAGYVQAGLDDPWTWQLFFTLLGTGLAAAGANALNQWRERRWDALMERTRDRALPSGRISPRHALLFGLLTSVAGTAVLRGIAFAGLRSLVRPLNAAQPSPVKMKGVRSSSTP